MIRHVVITGPESSGKSTLATLLGEQLHWPVVDEVARTLLTASGPVYSREDVIRIGLTQLQHNQQMLMQKGRVVADTDLLTIHIWLEDKFGAADESLIQLWLDHIPDLYLLQTPDMPWQPDPLREDPERRTYLFYRYRSWLDQYACPYLVCDNTVNERLIRSLEAIRQDR
ncbi:MAG: ATP-binding protein [Chitinophagales bacterium]|nr:ATP-binding protein [Chitinophagales bacterium]HAE13080.1 hypothetical protein [Bacteroidota bacterium]MCB9021608.1 ATP-binding protein [Chitinophagales bacterium]HPE97010.1 ATP-binding protein [Chitinophagales bacterium]HPR30334.1 ATP-binding protein [Chitinophagales bacterium]